MALIVYIINFALKILCKIKHKNKLAQSTPRSADVWGDIIMFPDDLNFIYYHNLQAFKQFCNKGLTFMQLLCCVLFSHIIFRSTSFKLGINLKCPTRGKTLFSLRFHFFVWKKFKFFLSIAHSQIGRILIRYLTTKHLHAELQIITSLTYYLLESLGRIFINKIYT